MAAVILWCLGEAVLLVVVLSTMGGGPGPAVAAALLTLLLTRWIVRRLQYAHGVPLRAIQLVLSGLAAVLVLRI